MDGLKKYPAWNWLEIPNWQDDFYGALLRHLFEWKAGKKVDEHSGLHPLAHVSANALILLTRALLDEKSIDVDSTCNVTSCVKCGQADDHLDPDTGVCYACFDGREQRASEAKPFLVCDGCDDPIVFDESVVVRGDGHHRCDDCQANHECQMQRLEK